MTPPLVTGKRGPCPCGECALTPRTSFGYDLIQFADEVCGTPLDPWQQLAAIHLGELLPDGRPRFRTILILVARQNGKSLLAKILILYWMFIEEVELTLITSSDRSYAKRAWMEIIERAQSDDWMRSKLKPGTPRLTISEETFETNRWPILDKNGEPTGKTKPGSELIFAANNRRAGRSTTLRRWLCDETREHTTMDAWDAATNAMNTVRDGQVVCISNQGDAGAILLDFIRDAALTYIDTGYGDPRVGLLEWSAPDGAEPDDVEALAQANPNMGRPGHGPDPDALRGAAITAKQAGGEKLSGFTTEVMCRRVELLDPAIEPELWRRAGQRPMVDLAEYRDKVALCLDISMDGQRADLVAAADIGGLIYLDVVAAWTGPYASRTLRYELADIVERVKPRAFGWFPTGPAAVVAADLKKNKRGGVRWPPRGVVLQELTTEAATAAMAFAELVRVEEIVQPNDESLTAQMGNAQRLRMGDRWTFGRRGSGPVSGAYAAAGAAWLARTLPPPPPKLSGA